MSFEYFRFENEQNAIFVDTLLGDPEKTMKIVQALNGIEMI
jgi:hypothetical protein